LNRSRYVRIIQGVLAFAAVLFGFATIVEVTRVLLGADPRYIVFWSLLIYNTSMGIAYAAAGIITWRSLGKGKYAAAMIFVFNFLVLGAIGYLYAVGKCGCYSKCSRDDIPNLRMAHAVSRTGVDKPQEQHLWRQA